MTIFLAAFGEKTLDDFLSRYERAGGKRWLRVREHIAERLAAYPVMIALFAMRSGLEECLPGAFLFAWATSLDFLS